MNFLFSSKVIAPRKGSLIAGSLYWPVYLFGLSLLLTGLFFLLELDPTSDKGFRILNLVYFTVNFVAVLIIFRPFLFESIRKLRGNVGRCILSALMAYGLCYILNLQLAFVYEILEIMPENQNEEAVTALLQQAPWQMLICTVIFAPITVECLARGILFGPFAKKVPVLGYILSIVVFSGMHVLGSIGSADWQTVILCFFQYVPLSLGLAWCYHRSGNILSPILLHAANNLLAVVATLSGL